MPRFRSEAVGEARERRERLATTTICDFCGEPSQLGWMAVVGPYAGCKRCLPRAIPLVQANATWLRQEYSRLAAMGDRGVHRQPDGMVITANAVHVRRYWNLLAIGVGQPIVESTG